MEECQNKVLQIDPEFQNKIPPLTDEEFNQLEENILEAGEVREPIITWNGVIVDGHNRYKIVQKHPEIKWRTLEMKFANKWAAIEWMCKNQLGRRNLTENQITRLQGKMFEARRNSQGGDRKSQRARDEKSKPQNEVLISKNKHGTAGEIASELGVAHATIERAYQFSKGIDAIQEVSPETADKILSNKLNVSKKVIRGISKADKEEIPKIIKEIEEQTIKRYTKPSPKPEYKGGGSREYRNLRQEIAQNVAEMYDSNNEPEYTVNDMAEEIRVNADNFIRTITNILQVRKALLVGEGKGTIKLELRKSIIDRFEEIERGI